MFTLPKTNDGINMNFLDELIEKTSLEAFKISQIDNPLYANKYDSIIYKYLGVNS
jgi:hypothetical protein